MKTMRWVTMAVAVAVVSFLVLTSFSAPASAGNTLVVDDDGYGSASDCGASDVAYGTIQAAIDAAGAGDVILVCPGTYNQDEANDRDPDTGGAGSNGFNIFVNKALTIRGINASGTPITKYNDVAAQVIAKRELPTFGQSAIFVQADGVTITGLEITGWSGTDNNKTVEVVGDDVTIQYSKLHALDSAAALYFDDRHFDAEAGTSHVQSYRVEANLIDGGGPDATGIRFSNGAGWSGDVSDRVITHNDFQDNCDAIAFVGPHADDWDDYPVGAATITGNSFKRSDRRHVIAWGRYLGGPGYGDLNWQGIVADNTFDKGAITWTTPGGDARSWDSDPFFNVRGIYSTIQRYAVNKAVAGDIVQVLPGVYNERLSISKSLDLRGAQYGVDPTQAGARTNPANESVVDLTGLPPTNPNVLVEIADGVSNVSVAGFTFVGSPTFHYADEAAVRAWDNYIAIRDNIISGYIDLLYKGPGQNLDVLRNRMTFNKNGVVVQPGTANNVNVSNNALALGSSPGGDEAAIYLTGVTQGTVSGNTAKNVAPNGRGFYGSNLTQLTVSGNTFTGNKDAVSIFGSSTFITISGNDLSSSLRYGINIKGQDIAISGNEIKNCADSGVFVDKNVGNTERVTISGNNITGNTNYGVKVNTAAVTATVDARNNWWGSGNGPRHATNTFNVGAQGGAVSGGVAFAPWLNAPAPGGASFAPVTTTDPVGSYASIQAGVNASNPGGTVNAKTGVFGEKVTVGKSVIVQAASSPVVDCGGPGNGFAIGANNVTINGFEIRNCSNGIQGQTSNSTISNNIIHDNLNYGGSNGVGILLWGDNDNNQISGNTIYNNDREGVFVGHCNFGGPSGECTAGTLVSSGNTISGNVIHDNGRYTQPNGPDASQYGIQLWNADGNEIKLNEVSNHKGSGFGVGVYLCSADSNDVHDNTVHDSQYNIAAYGCDGSSVGNNIHLNTLSAPTDSNVRLFGGSPSNTVNDNTMSGGVYGVRVSAGNTDTAVTANDVLGFKQNGVRIDGSSDVDVSTNSIDGQGACNSSFSPGSSPETDTRCYGVEWIDSTGTVSANTVTGVKVGAGTGAQTGVGIRASARSGKTTSATIDHNVVSAYQKNGMVITGQYGGTVSATVDTNTVTGLGPINFIAQNGVQVSSGASATLSNNNISGHDYTPSTYSAAGVLVQNATATIQENTIHGNMVGAYLQGATIPEFSGNTVTATRYTGVYLWLVDDSEVANNSISTSGIGLYLADSSGIAAKLNTISDNGDGVVIDGDSHNDSFTDNRILDNANTGVTVQPYYIEPSGLVFRLNQIAGNGTNGIDNTTSNVVDALSNWWGDVTGPYHPTKNPAGLGNDVSDNVLFDPWVKAIQYFGDTSIPVGSTARLKARFLNSSGTSPAVAGVTVVLELAASGGAPVAGSPFSVVTDGSGVATVNVPGLGIGLYDVTARWNPLVDGDSLTVFGTGDSDGDGVGDSVDNCPTVYNPDQLNSDGGRRPNGSRIPNEWASNPAQDKMGDACDPDDDNDGLPDAQEFDDHCPYRLVADSDGDGVLDGFEVAAGFDPCNAALRPGWEGGPDTDGDGLPDGWERGGYNTCAFTGDAYPGYNACMAPMDSDGDGCADTLEALDLNGDRKVNSLDIGLMNSRAAGKIPADDAVSERVFDVSKDGKVNSLDTGFMRQRNCLTTPNQLGCPVCPAE